MFYTVIKELFNFRTIKFINRSFTKGIKIRMNITLKSAVKFSTTLK